MFQHKRLKIICVVLGFTGYLLGRAFTAHFQKCAACELCIPDLQHGPHSQKMDVRDGTNRSN